MKTPPRGFTLIELMIVVAIIAILALMAAPSFQDKLVREQIVEASKLADIARAPLAQAWRDTKTLPSDNAEAGLPVADRIVGNHVEAVAVGNGAIHLTFGKSANGAIKDKTLTLRPAVVEDAPVVPVAWVCGRAAAPEKMSPQGRDRTDIPDRFLPLNCRGKGES